MKDFKRLVLIYLINVFIYTTILITVDFFNPLNQGVYKNYWYEILGLTSFYTFLILVVYLFFSRLVFRSSISTIFKIILGMISGLLPVVVLKMSTYGINYHNITELFELTIPMVLGYLFAFCDLRNAK